MQTEEIVECNEYGIQKNQYLLLHIAVFGLSPIIVPIVALGYGFLDGLYVPLSEVFTVFFVSMLMGLIPSVTTGCIAWRTQNAWKVSGKVEVSAWVMTSMMWGALISAIYGAILSIISFGFFMLAILFCAIVGTICSLISCLIISIKITH